MTNIPEGSPNDNLLKTPTGDLVGPANSEAPVGANKIEDPAVAEFKRTHAKSDVDGGRDALHHKLGYGPNDAFPGDEGKALQDGYVGESFLANQVDLTTGTHNSVITHTYPQSSKTNRKFLVFLDLSVNAISAGGGFRTTCSVPAQSINAVGGPYWAMPAGSVDTISYVYILEDLSAVSDTVSISIEVFGGTNRIFGSDSGVGPVSKITVQEV